MATFVFVGNKIWTVGFVFKKQDKSKPFNEKDYIYNGNKNCFNNGVMSYTYSKKWLFRKHFVNLWKQHGLWCGYCGHIFDLATQDYPTIDHIIPKICGGSNYIANLTPCCRRCNLEKGADLKKVLYPVMGFGHKGLKKGDRI